MSVVNLAAGGAQMRRMAMRYRAGWPALGLVLSAVVAYWFTLSSLADYLRLDTPLAYLLMLPFFALLVAAATLARCRNAPPAPREPHIDLLVGVPILVVALLIVTLLPVVWSTYYWSERPDVLSLALFLCGGTIVAYGMTWFWRMRSALVFILLMWPALYLHLMAGVMQTFTDATNNTFLAVAQHLPLGVESQPGGILTLPTQGGKPITVQLSTACSGVNGVLGMLLVGSALAVVFEGRRLRKLLWLLCGAALVFVFNVLRITSILWLAHQGHPNLALGSYHAVIGLVLFTLAVGVMLLLAPRFGLRLPDLFAVRRRAVATSTRPRSLGRARIPAAIGVLVVALLAMFSERDLGSYAAFIDGTGAPTVKAFEMRDATPAGWKLSYYTRYTWASAYFGTGSTFDRFVLDYGDTRRSEAWMDVVKTEDRGALEAYNLQSCFLFHSYQLHSTQRIDVGHGVTALLINYSDPQTGSQWATVSWAWPVVQEGQTAYERVSLTADLQRDGGGRPPDAQPTSGVRGVMLSIVNSFGGAGGSDAPYRAADHALEGVATSLVAHTVG